MPFPNQNELNNKSGRGVFFRTLCSALNLDANGSKHEVTKYSILLSSIIDLYLNVFIVNKAYYHTVFKVSNSL